MKKREERQERKRSSAAHEVDMKKRERRQESNGRALHTRWT